MRVIEPPKRPDEAAARGARARGTEVESLSHRFERNGADRPTPIGVHLSMPDGLRLPVADLIAAHERVPGVDALQLQRAARDEGVLVADGRAFFVDEPRSQAIRLCFSNASDAELVEAARRLARALDAVPA
jgi:hypothetical protein